jgi:hypothetical protein
MRSGATVGCTPVPAAGYAGGCVPLEEGRSARAYANGNAGNVALDGMIVTVAPNARGEQLVADHRYAVVIRLWVSFTPSNGIVCSQGLKGLQITQPLRHR